MAKKPRKLEVVNLKGGLLVNAEALKVLLKLEARGDTIEVKSGQLMITPVKAFSKAQADLVAQHRSDIKRLVQYVEREGWK